MSYTCNSVDCTHSTEQNIEGLSRGADDYITKPFHAQLLLARPIT